MSAGDAVTSGTTVEDAFRVLSVVVALKATVVVPSVELTDELVVTDVIFSFGEDVVVTDEGFVVVVVVVDCEEITIGLDVVVVVDVVFVVDGLEIGRFVVVGGCVEDEAAVDGETLGNRTHSSGVVKGWDCWVAINIIWNLLAHQRKLILRPTKFYFLPEQIDPIKFCI